MTNTAIKRELMLDQTNRHSYTAAKWNCNVFCSADKHTLSHIHTDKLMFSVATICWYHKLILTFGFLLNLLTGIQKAWLPSNIRGLRSWLVNSQAQIHSWSFWVLICAKRRWAVCHCLDRQHKTDAGVFQIFFWKGSDGQQVDNNHAVYLISGLLHKDIQI